MKTPIELDFFADNDQPILHLEYVIATDCPLRLRSGGLCLGQFLSAEESTGT